MSEVHRAKPLDADVNFLARALVPAAGNVQLFSLRRPASDEYRVVSLTEQRLHALDCGVVPNLGPHVDDALRLFVQTLSGNRNAGMLNRISPPARAVFS